MGSYRGFARRLFVGADSSATRGRGTGDGVGDPAADLAPAWSLLTPGTREAFRRASGADDAAWERGRGWALSFGLIALPYYLGSGSSLVAIARRSIAEALRG